MFWQRSWRFIVRFRLVLIGAITLLVTSNLNWGNNHWQSVLQTDARGYYAHLPAILLFGDLHFEMEDTLSVAWYQAPEGKFEYRHDALEVRQNKYHVGTSVLQLPFFGAGHLWAKWTAEPANGYSRPYMIALTWAGWFYLMLGLYFLGRWLKEVGFTPTVVTLILLALTFGTNLFYYALKEPGMSHVYSFAFVALFGWAGWRYFKSPGIKWLFLFSLSFGFVVLIRPINAIILLALPFLAGGWRPLFNGILLKLQKPGYLVAGVLPAVLIFSIQLILYKAQTGHWWVYSYGDESFYFGHPRMWAFLMSYKKGVFIYTPIAFVALGGLVWWWRKDRFRTVALIIFLIVMVYFLSSWWNWWYGGSFGQRAVIEYLPFFAILLGGLLTWASGKKARAAVVSLLFVLTIVCQIQIYQYRYGYIHWENMNREKYWKEFLRIDRPIQHGSKMESQ